MHVQHAIGASPMKIISIKVKPGASASVLAQTPAGEWRAQLKAPPVDDKANAELIALCARHFGCRKSAVTIRSGAASRIKRVAIDVDDGPSSAPACGAARVARGS